MSRLLSRRLWAPCSSFSKPGTSGSQSLQQCLRSRAISTSPQVAAEVKQSRNLRNTLPENNKSTPSSSERQTLSDLASLIDTSPLGSSTSSSTSPFSSYLNPLVAPEPEPYEEPHHIHVYSHKRNVHITLTKPNREALLTVSAGRIGFKKSHRKHYDSAFQVCSFALGRIQESGLGLEIKKLEVILRGFGNGREAFVKAMTGTEGMFLRGKIIRVKDATRLKIGGCRSKNIRRL